MKHSPCSIVIACIILLLSSCAKQGFPNGGPRDTTPPKAQPAKPPSESLNFSRDRFYIPFDEYVVIKDADNNVLISPPMRQKPDFTTKGKGIEVRLHDTLQPNTTYLFQFKNAIADYTEGNLLPSYEYVFSTGIGIDTMMLAGRVVDALTHKAIKETITVMAYSSDITSDTAATHIAPSYITRCDNLGNFAFHYIPAGIYRLVALIDADRNLRLSSTEAAAWHPSTFTATDSIDTASIPTLRMSTPPSIRQRIKSAEFAAPGRIVIVSTMPMQHLSTDGTPHISRINTTCDTLTLWCQNAKADSATIIISCTDLQDTLRLRYRPKRKAGSRRKGPIVPVAEPLISPLCSGTAAFYDRLLLAFTNPVVANTDTPQVAILSLRDSTTTLAPLTIDTNGLHATIQATLRSGENYNIHIPQGLFSDIYGTTSDSLDISLTPRDYATLTLDITNATTSPHLLIQLIDKSDSAIAQQPISSSQARISFNHIAGGEYRVRAILDSNGDAQWTPGDYRALRQPEEVVIFNKQLQLREKWEIEEHWIIKQPSATSETH